MRHDSALHSPSKSNNSSKPPSADVHVFWCMYNTNATRRPSKASSWQSNMSPVWYTEYVIATDSASSMPVTICTNLRIGPHNSRLKIQCFRTGKWRPPKTMFVFSFLDFLQHFRYWWWRWRAWFQMVGFSKFFRMQYVPYLRFCQTCYVIIAWWISPFPKPQMWDEFYSKQDIFYATQTITGLHAWPVSR